MGAVAATTLVRIAVYLNDGLSGSGFSAYLWVAELAHTIFALTVLLSWTVDLARDNRRLFALPGSAAPALLWSGLLALYVAIYAANYAGQDLGLFMTRLVRNLSFCAMLTTLALWFLLLGRRPRDLLMILIVGGFGLQFSGDAVVHALYDFAGSRGLSDAATLFEFGSDFACLALWWHAFSRSAPAPQHES
jgi:hypothetical protein